MLYILPHIFDFILDLIKDHSVFHNNSNNEQTLVYIQLAVTLFYFGHCGNAASIKDIAQEAGCLKEAVEKYMD